MKSRKHMARVADLACCACQRVPVQVHHLIGRDMKGMGQKSSDYFTIPLCAACHGALHNAGWREWERWNGSQLHHLAGTLAILLGDGT